MALTVGNQTYDLSTPAAASRTFSHNQNSGSGGYLFIIVAMADVVTYTGVTYNGVAMTLLDIQRTATSYGRWAIYRLANPATGANNVVVSFSGAQYNPVSTWALSVTECAGEGNIVFDNTSASPNSTAITVSTNSIIAAACLKGNNATPTITLDGSSRTVLFNQNINNYHAGALSATGLTSGSKSVSLSSVTDVAGFYLEIKEQAAAAANTSSPFIMFA
jgi:hypothetical protein